MSPVVGSSAVSVPWAAVIGEDDLVVGLVVHDAVEAGANLDRLDHGEGLQVEHRHVWSPLFVVKP